MDAEQDSSVTAAVVNVVCELGWRRPRDFLSLAPRLFELLVDGGNNWMAIKIIKLVGPIALIEGRLLSLAVCLSNAPGAALDQEIIAPLNQSNTNHARNVIALRVH